MILENNVQREEVSLDNGESLVIYAQNKGDAPGGLIAYQNWNQEEHPLINVEAENNKDYIRIYLYEDKHTPEFSRYIEIKKAAIDKQEPLSSESVDNIIEATHQSSEEQQYSVEDDVSTMEKIEIPLPSGDMLIILFSKIDDIFTHRILFAYQGVSGNVFGFLMIDADDPREEHDKIRAYIYEAPSSELYTQRIVFLKSDYKPTHYIPDPDAEYKEPYNIKRKLEDGGSLVYFIFPDSGLSVNYDDINGHHHLLCSVFDKLSPEDETVIPPDLIEASFYEDPLEGEHTQLVLFSKSQLAKQGLPLDIEKDAIDEMIRFREEYHVNPHRTLIELDDGGVLVLTLPDFPDRFTLSYIDPEEVEHTLISLNPFMMSRDKLFFEIYEDPRISLHTRAIIFSKRKMTAIGDRHAYKDE